MLGGSPAGLDSHVSSMEGNAPSLESDNHASASDSMVASSGHRTGLSPITVIHAKAPSTGESAQIQIELQQQISKCLSENVIDAGHY